MPISLSDIVLPKDPDAALEAVTKQYVDGRVMLSGSTEPTIAATPGTLYKQEAAGTGGNQFPGDTFLSTTWVDFWKGGTPGVTWNAAAGTVSYVGDATDDLVRIQTLAPMDVVTGQVWRITVEITAATAGTKIQCSMTQNLKPGNPDYFAPGVVAIGLGEKVLVAGPQMLAWDYTVPGGIDTIRVDFATYGIGTATLAHPEFVRPAVPEAAGTLWVKETGTGASGWSKVETAPGEIAVQSVQPVSISTELWIDPSSTGDGADAGIYLTKAALDAAWPDPPDGMKAMTTGPVIEWTAQGGDWWKFNQVLWGGQITSQVGNTTGGAGAYFMQTTTLTIPPRRMVLLTFYGQASSTVNGWAFVDLMNVGTGTQLASARCLIPTANGNWPAAVIKYIETGGSALTATFGVRMNNPYTQGTASMYASATEPAMFTVADVGGY